MSLQGNEHAAMMPAGWMTVSWTALESVAALGCIAIAAVLLYIAGVRRDFAHRPLFVLLGACLGVAGLDLGARLLAAPAALAWGLKGLLALSVGATALALVRALPRIRALPSRAQLQEVNLELQRQVNQRRAAVLALTESEARFRSTFDHAPLGMGLVDLDGGWRMVNPTLCRMFGYSEEELLAMGLLNLIGEEDPAGDALLLDELLRGRRWQLELERRCRRRDGSRIWVHLSLAVVPGVDGLPSALIAHLADVSAQRDAAQRLAASHAELERRVAERTRELEESNRRLERLARYDALTGLLNRRALMERLTESFSESRRYRRPLTVLMLDLDHFKEINDRHGHLLGDQAIGRVGRIIAESIRASDFAGRFGGDEFCVVLTQTGLEEARTVTEKLAGAVRAARLEAGGESVALGCSIGVAALDAATPHAEALLAEADARLYAAKRAGRGRIAGLGRRMDWANSPS